jgi:hypothetical protein
METNLSSESLAITYQSAKHYISEGSNHHAAQAWPTGQLANFNLQEFHIIREETPEGSTTATE